MSRCLEIRCENCGRLMDLMAEAVKTKLHYIDPCVKANHLHRKSCKMHRIKISGEYVHVCVAIVYCLRCKKVRHYRPHLRRTCIKCGVTTTTTLPVEGVSPESSSIYKCMKKKALKREIKYH